METETAVFTVVFLTYAALWVLYQYHRCYLTITSRVSSRTDTLVTVQSVLARGAILADVRLTVVNVGRTVSTLKSIGTLASEIFNKKYVWCLFERLHCVNLLDCLENYE